MKRIMKKTMFVVAAVMMLVTVVGPAGAKFLTDGRLDNPAGLIDGYVTLKAIHAAIPEPAAMLLIGFGLIGLAGLRRKLTQ